MVHYSFCHIFPCDGLCNTILGSLHDWYHHYLWWWCIISSWDLLSSWTSYPSIPYARVESPFLFLPMSLLWQVWYIYPIRMLTYDVSRSHLLSPSYLSCRYMINAIQVVELVYPILSFECLQFSLYDVMSSSDAHIFNEVITFIILPSNMSKLSILVRCNKSP